MAHSDDALQSLREAVQLSPNNVPLRQHLADTLMGQGRPDEAAKEYRAALALAPDNERLKVGLATAFYQEGKYSQALVIVEDLLKAAAPAARAILLHARLMLQAGDVRRAVAQYRHAIETDPAVADAELAEQLGIGPEGEREVVEGRVRATWEEPAAAPESTVERPRIAFADVGGMEALKDEIRMKIIHPLTHPELYRAYGKAIGGGILMYGPPGCGKAQPLHALVQTPGGPKRMGDLCWGDLVCTPRGGSARVVGIFPQGKRPIYRITFADGDAVEACAEHLWQVDSVHRGWTGRVVNTAYLMARSHSPSGARELVIRVPQPIEMSERAVSIPPYLLGILLGDGGFTNSNLCFSTADQTILQCVGNSLDKEYVVKKSYRPYDYRIVKKKRSSLPNRYKDELRRLSLWGHDASEKFVPAEYLYNTIDNRWELLRGLMDSDGRAEKTGRIVYSTVSPQLARDVKWLVESLGGIATIHVKLTTGRDCYEIGIRLNNPADAFHLERKRQRCKTRVKYFVRRFIHQIDLVGETEAQCILIDDPDHLYLTDHCVVTHNTHLARATAGEVKAGFLAVGINEVLDMWIGQSERNLHEVFQRARDNTPCVLFFDEVDALGAARSDMRHSGGRHLINQFLSELDGIGASNEGVLVLAATNAPWHLDSAFRRPGRFDRILFVPPPDAPARAAILRILCRGKPVETIDYDHLAKKTEHFSGADLKAVLDIAVEAKLREALKAGVPRPLTTKDLTTAAATVKPTTREWFSTARNYALYSNQGGLYDDILKYLKL